MLVSNRLIGSFLHRCLHFQCHSCLLALFNIVFPFPLPIANRKQANLEWPIAVTLSKTDSLRLEGINNKTFDVLTLSETSLDSSTSDAEIKLPGFVCLRLDRTGNKEGYGGVAMYVRKDLAFRLRNDINTGGQECLWIELI